MVAHRISVGWDTPVSAHLTWFALSDPEVSDEVKCGTIARRVDAVDSAIDADPFIVRNLQTTDEIVQGCTTAGFGH
jgi:hypothetical protein